MRPNAVSVSRTNVRRCATGAFACVVLLAPATGRAQDATAAPPEAPAAQSQPPPKPPPPAGLSRWLEFQTGTLSTRYRTIENSAGVRTANHLQYAGQLRARIKFDPDGTFTLNGMLGTGNNFTGSWNNTGIGTGEFAGPWYLKQAFLAWTPADGVELSYGGLGFVRGQATEITTFDNDAYMVGERITLERPSDLFFDEIAVTSAFVGDFSEPGFHDRTRRLIGERNYHQVSLSRALGANVTASADYTRLSSVPYLRFAAMVKTAPLRMIDTVRLEHYSRFGDDESTGFSVAGEKAFGPRVTVGAGFADIDPGYPTINGDRYVRGRRFFETASVKLTRELTAQLFMTQAVNNDFAVPNKHRIDVVVIYNVLTGMRRAGWLR